MSIPPQVLLDVQRGHVSVSEDGSSTLTFESGRRYFVPVELAEDLVLSGAATPVRPAEAVEVESPDQLVEGWLAERAYIVDLEEWLNLERAAKGDTEFVKLNQAKWAEQQIAIEKKHPGRLFTAPKGE